MILATLQPHKLLSLAHTDTVSDTVVRGDIIVGNATPKWERLPIGASGTILASDGTDITWQTPAAAGIPSGSAATNQVTYWSSPTTIAGNAKLTYDPIPGHVGIGGTYLSQVTLYVTEILDANSDVGIYGAFTSSVSANNANTFGGLVQNFYTGGPFTGHTIIGFIGRAENISVNGSVSSLEGIRAEVGLDEAASTTVDVYGLRVFINAFNGLSTTSTGVHIPAMGGLAPTSYGLRIADQTVSATRWAIASDGGNSYHIGNLKLGTSTAPTNQLSINNATTADNLAEALIFTGTTTQKGLVVQGIAAQSANLIESQASTGAVNFLVSANGRVAVRSAALDNASTDFQVTGESRFTSSVSIGETLIGIFNAYELSVKRTGSTSITDGILVDVSIAPSISNILNGINVTASAINGDLAAVTVIGGKFVANQGQSGFILTNLIGVEIQNTSTAITSAITTSKSLSILAPSFAGGDPTTHTGIEVANQGNTGSTTVYGIHVMAQSQTGGNVYGIVSADDLNGFGTITPISTMDIVGRITEAQGTDVASVAGAITLGTGGNLFEITGTNAITLISNVGWKNGSIVTLMFTSTASLVHGTATSGTNITILLAGAANFSATANDTITLRLGEIGGTQAWRELCRTVI